jgi:hypothetical protein
MARLWASIEHLEPDAFVAQVEALTRELPEGSAVALFERACAQDSTGHPDRSVAMLREELARGHDELHGAVRAFLALALVDCGRSREAAGQALLALSPCLPRYNRSLERYARELVEPAVDGD